VFLSEERKKKKKKKKFWTLFRRFLTLGKTDPEVFDRFL